MDKLKIKWWPQPRQLSCLRACGLSHPFEGGEPGTPVARAIGYGGAAGGGKSDALLMVGVVAGLTYPGCKVGYFRREFPQLEGPGGAIMRSQEILGGQAKWHGTMHRWTLPTRSVIQFCHCKQPEDVYNYQSQQFDVILIDEATQFSEAMISYLMTRSRLTVDMPQPLFVMASNPGNEGHVWFQRIFQPEGATEVVHSARWEGADKDITTFFLPALLEDNPALERRDPSYRDNLEAQPEHIKQQLLYGRWDAFEGQVFSEFAHTVHVCRPFPIPAWWRKWRANDPGYTDPFAWYWMAAGPDGQVFIYREFTRARSDQKLPYSEQAKRVVELSVVDGEIDHETGASLREKIDFTVTGRDAFNRHPETGKAIIDYYNEGGVKNCIEAVTDRQFRAAVWHEYLKPYEGPDNRLTAKVRIFSTCRQLVKTLPLLAVDPNDAEKVMESDIDHWFDAAGYGLIAWHVQKSKAPEPEKGVIRSHKEKLAKAGKLARRRLA